MDFKVGDKVSWASQSGGYTKAKAGAVVYILGPGKVPVAIHQELFPGHKRMFDSITTACGPRYLIEVRQGPKAKPRLYMPVPSQLRLVE